MPALEIINLSKRFKTKKGVVEAVKPLNLTVEKGEVFGFLGPNGAGKSTTIKMLMGFLTPSSGGAKIAGCDISSAEARRHVGYLPENPNFYDYLTAEEYLRFITSLFEVADGVAVRRIEELLRLLELWDARKRLIRSYSKGMVQRVGLAQALVHNPDILVLDEPMSGLDPIGRVVVKQIIKELKQQGKTVFFSTHIISDIEAVCDRVGIIYQGELKVDRQVPELIAEGLNGYTVTVANSEGRQASEFVVSSKLVSRLSILSAAGETILLVEPQRKTLEEYFLQVVHS